MAEGQKKMGNGLGDGNTGPGIKWNPQSAGTYDRGLQKNVVKPVETEHRKGNGAKQ